MAHVQFAILDISQTTVCVSLSVPQVKMTQMTQTTSSLIIMDGNILSMLMEQEIIFQDHTVVELCGLIKMDNLCIFSMLMEVEHMLLDLSKDYYFSRIKMDIGILIMLMEVELITLVLIVVKQSLLIMMDLSIFKMLMEAGPISMANSKVKLFSLTTQIISTLKMLMDHYLIGQVHLLVKHSSEDPLSTSIDKMQMEADSMFLDLILAKQFSLSQMAICTQLTQQQDSGFSLTALIKTELHNPILMDSFTFKTQMEADCISQDLTADRHSLLMLLDSPILSILMEAEHISLGHLLEELCSLILLDFCIFLTQME